MYACRFARNLAIGYTIAHLSVLISFGQAAALNDIESSPTLQLLRQLPNDGRLLLYEKFLTMTLKRQSQPYARTNTLYYLEFENARTAVRTRIWERGYWMDFRNRGLGMPRGFAIGLADAHTTSVAIAFWEGTSIRFFAINATRPVRPTFESAVKKWHGQELSQWVKRETVTDAPHSSIPFRQLYPLYSWNDAIDGNPPGITKIWHDKEAWHMTIAAAQPEMHLLLRDGAKEWVWVNKP